MSEGYRSHVIEAPNCFGVHLNLGSLDCENCVWYIECQEEVYTKITQVLANEKDGDEDGNNPEQ